MLIGLVLYALCYAAAEALVYRYGGANRFYAIRAAPPARFDFVIVGASHAAVFDYRDMNERLQAMTGTKIINLSVVGGGVAVNELLLDYFLTRHRTVAVLYVIDSFAFYSSSWNEERLQDRRLFARAPFDPALASLLLQRPATRAVALDYLVGFSKINNRDRFTPDVPADAGPRFERRYRPVAQIDRERIAYLYPSGEIDRATFRTYLDRFDKMVGKLQARGIDVIVLKPPIPTRVLRMIPGEAEFDAALAEVIERRHVEFHDFSRVGNEEALFQDTDHLNRAGVLQFFETTLAPLLRAHRQSRRDALPERVRSRAIGTLTAGARDLPSKTY